MIKDGWHRFKDFYIYVEDGYILKCYLWSTTIIYLPYRYNKFTGIWSYARNVKYSTLRRRYGTVYEFIMKGR